MKNLIKENAANIIHIYKNDGPQWKPGKDIIHLSKRIARQDIPIDFTLSDYNRLITRCVTDKESDLFLYRQDHFDQAYFVFRNHNWLIIIGENTILETAMVSRNPQKYLTIEKGYTYLGTIEEVLQWKISD